MKKKIFALFLSLCMVLTMMPSMGFATNTAENKLYFLEFCDELEPDDGNWKSSKYSDELELEIGKSCSGVYGIMDADKSSESGNEKTFKAVGNVSIAGSDSAYVLSETITNPDGNKISLTNAAEVGKTYTISYTKDAEGEQSATTYTLNVKCVASSGGSEPGDDGDDSDGSEPGDNDDGGDGEEDSWQPENGYVATPEVGIWGGVVPCKTLPTGSSYESFEKLLESGCLLGDVDPYQDTINPKNTNLTKHINMSLAPGADENSFYVLHPEGTTLTQESYQQFLYMVNGGHEYIIDPIRDGNERDRRSRGSKKLDDIYTITPVRTDSETFKITCNVGENLDGTLTLVASKVTLKGNTYHGHNNIYSKFTANVVRDGAEEQSESEDKSYAVVCLAKGMDITIEGATDAVEYINGDLEFSEWAMDITPNSELIWSKSENETMAKAFYQNACALLTTDGQGKIMELCLDLKPGYVLEKITDSSGKAIDYVAEHFQYLLLKDEDGEALIGKEFWALLDSNDGGLYEEYDLSPAGNGDPDADDSPAFLEAYHCFAAEKSYTAEKIKEKIGSENISGTIEFLKKYGYSVEQKNEYTNYKLYFNASKDDDITGITFHIKKAESTGSDFSAKNNGSSVSDGEIKYDRLAADSNTKSLLKENLTKIGTRGYEVLDVYDMKWADGNEASGLYNITIPVSRLSGVDPTKCKVVYYADDDKAVPLEMETTYTTDTNGNPNGIVFTTGHFSNYAIIYEQAKSSGGSSGGYVAPTTDTVTNKTEDKTADTSATTTATVKNTTTTAADGTKTVAAKVDTATADKIVAAALENKSAEVVVDAATAKTVTETAAGTRTEVTLPATTVSDIAKKTEAAVTIKADAAEIKLDKEAVKAVAEAAGAAGEVKLEVETVAQNENKVQVDLKLVTSNGNISDFKGGSVSVTVKLSAALATKPVVCVYIDAHSTYHKVGGQKNADGTFTFKTGHFSSYAIVAEEEADKVIAEQTAKVEKLVKALSLKARSAKTAKGYIKVNLTVSEDEVKAIEDLGYTVKYKFYRSTKKAKGYKAKLEGTGKTYTNTTGKKGTKYYYKARVMVYDAQGALVTKTELAQCKYACRTR